MPLHIDGFPLTGPLALIGLALSPLLADRAGSRAAGAARLAALFALLVAGAAAALVFAFGPRVTPTLGLGGVGASLFLDRLGATMSLLVAFVGVIVVAYSGPYLGGEPSQPRFLRRLLLTLGAVLTLTMAGNLLLFALAWIATSLALNALLLFFPERPAAVLAARKKFVVSRLGDLALLAGMALAYGGAGTLDIPALLADARSPAPPPALAWAAFAFALAAMLKSAQFPLHGWLIEVMETPTPVSALLHAGVINAGGFLVLRFAALVALSPGALHALALVGAATALFGSSVMLTQTSVKGQLAHSTIAQMGFMMLECGLGAFSAAWLHLLAHSLYKAHAFLSSGGVIDIARASWSPNPGGDPHPLRLAVGLTAAALAALPASALLGVDPLSQPGPFALACILGFGLTHLIAQGLDERATAYVFRRTFLSALAVAALYFALQGASETLFAETWPAPRGRSGLFDLIVAALVVASFGALTVFQTLLPTGARSGRAHALYAHVSNGLYINTLANRWAIRLWPSPSPYASTSAGDAP